MKFIEISVKRSITTLMLFFAILLLSIYAFFKLKTDYMPDYTFPAITVVCTYENVGPNEIEETITRKLVEIAGTIQNVKRIKSTSAEGISIISIEFTWGTDINISSNDMREKIDRIQKNLPLEASKPYILKFDTSMIPIMMMVAETDNLAIAKKYCEDILKNELEQVEGVAQVDVEGGSEKEIQIKINKKRLEAFGLTFDDIYRKVKSENINLPAGDINIDRSVFTIRGIGEYTSLDELKKLVIAIRDLNQIPIGLRDIVPITQYRKIPIYLEYIAEIDFGYKDIKVIRTVNNKTGIVLTFRKQSGSNTVEVVKNIKKKLEKIKYLIPKNIKLYELMNTANRIKYSINDLSDSAIFGGLIAFFVIFIFLRNIKATLIIAISIPSSIIVTFLLMYLNKMTLNMMSFGGLALGVGMLVDNSIVVLENIFRHYEKGENPIFSSIYGTKQVFMPIFASTATTICVFLPVLFIEGISGIMFKELALTVTFSLLASLFISVTMVPMLASKFLLKEKSKSKISLINTIDIKIKYLLDRLDLLYENLLKKALNNKKKIIISSIVVFILSLLLFRFIPTGFMPESERDEFNIDIELKEGTRLNVSKNIAQNLSTLIKQKVRGVEFVSARIGTGEDRASIVQGKIGSHLITLRIVMPARDSQARRSMKDVRKDIRKILSHIPDLKLVFSRSLMSGTDSPPVEIQIFGYDYKKSLKVANEIVKILKTIEHITDIQISQKYGLKEYIVKVDRIKASTFGLSVSDIFSTIRTGFAGQDAAIYRDKGEEIKINIRLKEIDRIDIDRLLSVKIKSPLGFYVTLKSFAHIEIDQRPIIIQRLGNQRVIYITANTDTGIGEKIIEIDKKIREKLYPLPDGISIGYGSEYKDREDSFKELTLAFIISVFLIYMIMASQFESIKHPLIIIFSIPLSLIGVIILFFFINQEFNIIGFLGIIILAGIVVNNAIVLIDYINILRRENGFSLENAILHAGKTRLRPILMTTLTTVLGLLPMALGTEPGSEARAPMALSIISGLTFSTALTLIIIPLIYYIFEKKSIKNKEKKRKEREILNSIK